MQIIADFHLHSHYSMATSKECVPERLALWAGYKGLTLIGTGDFTHPAWRAELKEKLVPAEPGLYRLRPELEPPGSPGRQTVRFVVTGEISSIYKRGGKTRKIHNLLVLPDLAAADRLAARLERVGNVQADGRPILGLDSYDLLAMVLDLAPESMFIPAHIWTPHFSLFGAYSGFDAIEECFGELAAEIFALETGLSSDPSMNWRWSALDRFALVSNSDAHSPHNLAREANLFDLPELSFAALRAALRGEQAGFLGTIEFFPEEGKYHYDGHRNCGLCWSPEETLAHQGHCPKCGRPVTLGVYHRVLDLADRPAGTKPATARPYTCLIPLDQVLGDVLGAGPGTRKVQRAYHELVQTFGAELTVLRETPPDEIAAVAGERVAAAILGLRAGDVEIRPGFDGEYGKIKVFLRGLSGPDGGQGTLFVLKEQGGGERASAEPLVSFEEGGPAAGRAEAAATEAAAEGVLEPLPETGLAVTGAITPEAGLLAQKEEVGSERTGALGKGRPAPEPVAALLEGLSPEQAAVVRATGGPILVIAGPGTGKTRTLTRRIAYLVQARGVKPETITATTFTNRAAAEMRTRLEALLGKAARRLRIGTFHQICLELLTAEDDPGFTVIGEEESLMILTRLVAEVRRQEGRGRGLEGEDGRAGTSLSPQRLAREISLLKGKGLLPTHPEVPAAVRPFYLTYQQELARLGYWDFDDLLLATWNRFQTQPERWRRFAPGFTHLLVDEFQDVNPLQYQLTRLWAGDGENLMVIGDPDQAIYGFRGAEPYFFRQLALDYPTAQKYTLTVNYRSTPAIVRSAASVMAASPAGTGLLLKPARARGLPVRYRETATERSEAITVAHTIGELVGGTSMLAAHRAGEGAEGMCPGAARAYSFAEIAVLTRTQAQFSLLEECLAQEGIPYRVVGRAAFWQHPTVRAAMAYLDEWAQAQEGGRQAGDEQEGDKEEPPVTEILTAWAATQGLNHETIDAEMVARLRALAWPGEGVIPFLRRVRLGEEGDYERPGFGSGSERVTLMTIHAAKGLEFPVVFLVGLEEGLLPLVRREGASLEVEEERRLFYVGLTRAQEELLLLSARTRMVRGRREKREPSRFLALLPDGYHTREKEAERPWRRKMEGQMSLFKGL